MVYDLDERTDDPVTADTATEPLLALEELSVSFRNRDRLLNVVRSASLTIDRGEVVGLVGESGSGKTVTSLAVIGLVQSMGGQVRAKRFTFQTADLTGMSERGWRRLRGRKIGMIFQQPTRALNPAFTVGDHIAEVLATQFALPRKEAWKRAVSMLDRVHIPNAAQRARDYPHTFSGGMCQRVMIAMAMACEPDLLIADEPTTALDVTVQSAILDLMDEIQQETGIAVLYITHDLGVVAETCDRVVVMYAGETVEEAPVDDLFYQPQHPYTAGLLAAVPRRGQDKRFVTIPGTVPTPGHMPDGCRFAPRCAYAVDDRCTGGVVDLVPRDQGRSCRCRRIGEFALRGVDE